MLDEGIGRPRAFEQGIAVATDVRGARGGPSQRCDVVREQRGPLDLIADVVQGASRHGCFLVPAGAVAGDLEALERGDVRRREPECVSQRMHRLVVAAGRDQAVAEAEVEEWRPCIVLDGAAHLCDGAVDVAAHLQVIAILAMRHRVVGIEVAPHPELRARRFEVVLPVEEVHTEARVRGGRAVVNCQRAVQQRVRLDASFLEWCEPPQPEYADAVAQRGKYVGMVRAELIGPVEVHARQLEL